MPCRPPLPAEGEPFHELGGVSRFDKLTTLSRSKGLSNEVEVMGTARYLLSAEDPLWLATPA
jgi:hypothetical protein